MTEESAKANEVEGLVTKVVRLACCGNTWCLDCWQQCWEPEVPKHRIQKTDIQPILVLPHKPITRLDSTASHASIGSTLSGCSAPPCSPGVWDRMDSFGSSRKGSVSSDAEFRPRTGPTPIINMKPIEFWTANRENVQPRKLSRHYTSESEISIEDLKPEMYPDAIETGEESLTDEEKLARFKLGQVHFGMQYDVPSSSLVIRIIGARDLPTPASSSTDSNRPANEGPLHSYPYAKICLLPDQKTSHQTTVQRKTQTPQWDEVFTFELPFKEVQRRTLEITVKDFDKYSHHCVIGKVHLPLEDINLIKGGHMWKPLLPSDKENTDLGELLMSLNYLPTAGRLTVDIIKGKQFIQTDVMKASDPYVKVTLCYGRKTMKSKKTTSKKTTMDPVFNESLSFNVTSDQLNYCSLVVTVLDYKVKSKDEFIGRIVMGKNASGPYEVTHWNRMLQCQRSPVAQWHTLMSRQHCLLKCPLPEANT